MCRLGYYVLLAHNIKIIQGSYPNNHWTPHIILIELVILTGSFLLQKYSRLV
uniref:Uncharacterized protein n=1 Tax=Siphoviridae sp. ctTC45 TaxID=2827573 RepID=A0A8S5LQL1_9CAUD|nr:MAG TPA: hypothetical protein [Siphoviridae sp. ctTC45]DAU79872.1 MAG TPA: hypothetical protein [Caudoviricetes sp.]